MNPHAAPGSVTADYTKAAGKGVYLRQPHQLPAVTSVPESKIDPVVTSASPPSGGPSNISTATPQPNRGSTNDLQGGRAAGSNGKITVPAKLRQSINSVNDN